MFNRLKTSSDRYDELSELLCQPEIIQNQNEFKKYGKEQADLQDMVLAYRKYEEKKNLFDDNQSIIDDGEDKELTELAEEENKELKAELASMVEALKVLMIPKDPDDSRDIILEIRAGTGGDEAALFVMDIYNMYNRYAQNKGWKVELLSISETQHGGAKEILAAIRGKNVYQFMRYEGGVHRVQRVPKTETQGRVHTSAITVAVLPEVEEQEVQIDSADLKIDIYRSSGPGGQSVNTTDSAVRITHIPTGITVSMQDEKSQHKNREKGMKVIASRVSAHYSAQEKAKEDEARKKMVGSGDRSERIRTYNFPQGRLTDHRINLTLYSLEAIMLGDINEVVGGLQRAANALALSSNN